MKTEKMSLTIKVILIFLIFNILSVMIFTVYMQSSSQKGAMEYTRSSLLEMTKEKGQLLSITFDRIRNRVEVMGMYMEEALREEVSGSLDSQYALTEEGTMYRKKDESKENNAQSNIVVPNTSPLSAELIYEINVTEKLDSYFEQIIENEEVSWCYIVTKGNLLRCSPYGNLNDFFTSDHSQVSDIFYTQATNQYNPEHKAVWTEPYYDYLGTGWTITCSQPVYDKEGELFGVICLDLSIEKIKEKYFTDLSSGQAEKQCWMSNNGEVYYHTDYDRLTANQGERLEKNIFEESMTDERREAIKKSVLSGGSGIAYFEEDGKERMFIYSQVAGADSVIFTEIGVDDFDSFYTVNLKGIIIVALINIVLAVIFAVILYFSFSRPMKNLVSQAQKISKGNYATIEFKREADYGNNEICKLNEALRIMNENIVTYMDSLIDKNREIKVILEAIEETLMIVDVDGTVNMKSKDFVTIPTEELKNGIEEVLVTKNPFSEQRVVDGEAYKCQYYPILKDGKVIKIVVSRECITKSVLQEKELQQIEKMAGVGQLAAAIVHELKNILARIRGAAYILKLTEQEESEELCAIQKGVDEAEDVISTLLDFSRRDKNGSEMIHLGTLVNQILLLSKKEIIGKGIVIKKEIDKEFYVNSKGREAIKVILQNIIINAIQAVHCDGEITIECCRKEDKAFIRIKDNGDGIRAEPKEKVFEPFWTTKENGTGIGLWITKRLVDTLEGEIILGEPEDGGTEFVVLIPAERKEAEGHGTGYAG